jgi:hypothetical protein
VPVSLLEHAISEHRRELVKPRIGQTTAAQPSRQDRQTVFNYGPVTYSHGLPTFAGSPTAVSPQAVVQRSSPPIIPGDDDLNLERYIDWLSEKRPQQAAGLADVCLKLSTAGFGYSDLRDMTDKEWDDLSIAAGHCKLVRRLQRSYRDELFGGGISSN